LPVSYEGRCILRQREGWKYLKLKGGQPVAVRYFNSNYNCLWFNEDANLGSTARRMEVESPQQGGTTQRGLAADSL